MTLKNVCTGVCTIWRRLVHNSVTPCGGNSYGGEIFLLEQQKNLSPITVERTFRVRVVQMVVQINFRVVYTP